MMRLMWRQLAFHVKSSWWLLLSLFAAVVLLVIFQQPSIVLKGRYAGVPVLLEEPAMFALLIEGILAAAVMIVLLRRIYAPSVRWQMTPGNRWSYIMADLVLLFLVFSAIYLFLQWIYYQNSIGNLRWQVNEMGRMEYISAKEASQLFFRYLPQQFVMRQVFPCDIGNLLRAMGFLLFLSSLCEYLMLLLVKKTAGNKEKLYVGAFLLLCAPIYIFTTVCFQTLLFGAGLLWNLYRCRKAWEPAQMGG